MRSFLLLSIAILFSISSFADIIYVNKANNNVIKNGNSWNTAYANLSKACDRAEPGDEIWVVQGDYRDYNSAWNMDTDIQGEMHKGNLFLHEKQGVEVYGGFIGNESLRSQRNWESNTTIINKIDHQKNDPPFIAPTTIIDGFHAYTTFSQFGNDTNDFDLNLDREIRIQNMVFHERMQGYSSLSNVNNIHFYNCEFKAGFIGSFKIPEADSMSQTYTVENCLFKDYSEDSYNNRTKLYSCNVINCTFSNISIAEIGRLANFKNCLFTNNTFLDGFCSSGEWCPLAYECTFANCTFTNNEFERSFRFANAVNSIFHNNTGSDPVDPGTSVMNYCCNSDQDFPNGVGNISHDPDFINPSNSNYRIEPCSQLVDAGLGYGPTDYDLAGESRFHGDAVDIGCYERQDDFPHRLYVNQNASGNNDGTNWTHAYTSLQTALQNACPRTEIWVANSGAYYPHNQLFTDRDEFFEIPSGVELYGGFNGTENTLSQRDVVNNASILSAATGLFGIDDNNYHVVEMQDGIFNTTVDGFRIFGGNANGPGLDSQGGGILVRNTDATIENCYFENNHAAVDGGAIKVNSQNNVSIIDCEFYNNEASSGGAVSTKGGNLQFAALDRCEFWSNTASAGGAIDANQHTVISNCLFYLNDATDAASTDAVKNQAAGLLEVYNSTFYDNDENAIVNYGDLIMKNSFIFAHSTFPVDNFGNQTISFCVAGVGLSGSNNQSTSSPLLIDPANHNYRPQPGSPLINNGEYIAASGTKDLDDNNRVQGGSIDVGCYEDPAGCVNEQDACLTAIEFELDGSYFEETLELNCASNFETTSTSCGPITRDIWVKLDYYPTGMNVKLIPEEGQDLSITIYSGECGNLNEIDCSNNEGPGVLENLQVDGIEGVDQVYVRIAAIDNSEGYITLRVQPNQCSIFNCIVDVPSLCFDFNGEQLHEREITLVYAHPPYDAHIKVSGPDLAFPMSFEMDASPQTLLLSNLPANNEELDLTFELVSDLVPGCEQTFQNVVPAYCCTPSYDECEGAKQLETNFPYLEKFDCSTHDEWIEAPCILDPGNDNWYTFTAPFSGGIEIHTQLIGAPPNYNIRHTVFEGTCGDLTVIDCANDPEEVGIEESFTTGLIPGETYYLRVSSWANQIADYEILMYPHAADDCLGDFDNSGSIDTADLLILLADFGCQSDCDANISGEDQVDTSDLITFLSVYGSLCE